jgi:hypothetical protein
MGTFYSLKVSRAQMIYHHIRYGCLTNAPVAEVVSGAESAHRLYPHNYYLCESACRALVPACRKNPEDLKSAMKWCDRGLSCNSYNPALNRLKAGLLGYTNPRGAVKSWQKYLAWQFWSPRNLVLMVELQAQAGMLEEAAATLVFLKGHSGYKAAANSLHRAIIAEMQPPPAM